MTHTEQIPERRSLAEGRQMRAWFALTRPGEYKRLDQALLSADLNEDEAGYDRLEGEMIGQWYEHRDDPLPPRKRRSAELAQSTAWLGDDQGLSWRHAHALAVTGSEQDSDIDRLIGLWREHRDDPVLPDSVTGHVSLLLGVREARLAEAKVWHKAHDPQAHGQWEQRRDFAESVGDEWSDDRSLIRSWLDHTGTASTTTKHSASPEPSTRRTPPRGQARRGTEPARFGASPRRNGGASALGL